MCSSIWAECECRLQPFTHFLVIKKKNTADFSLSCLLLHFQQNQLTRSGQMWRHSRSLSLSVMLICSLPFLVSYLLCFLGLLRSRHRFQLLYSTVVNNCHTKEQSPALWKKKKKTNACLWIQLCGASCYPASLLFPAAHLLCSIEIVCVGARVPYVFFVGGCVLFLIVGQVGCEGHPVTLIPSQTWCVDCKYDLLFFKPSYTIFPEFTCMCIYVQMSFKSEGV